MSVAPPLGNNRSKRSPTLQPRTIFLLLISSGQASSWESRSPPSWSRLDSVRSHSGHYIYIYIYRSMLWWWQCSVRYSLPLSSTSWDLGPRQYHFRDNSALNPFNQPTELSFIHGRHYCVMRQPGSDRQSSAAVAEQSVQQLSSIIQHNNYLPGCITDDTQPALVARGNAPMNGSTWLRARSRDQNTTITS